MTLKRLAIGAAMIVAGATFASAATFAQDATRANDIAPAEAREAATVEVEFAGFTFELEADEPVQACVVERVESLDGSDVEYRLFVREPGGEFSSVGVYPSPAIGALATANAGDCTSLEGFE